MASYEQPVGVPTCKLEWQQSWRRTWRRLRAEHLSTILCTYLSSRASGSIRAETSTAPDVIAFVRDHADPRGEPARSPDLRLIAERRAPVSPIAQVATTGSAMHGRHFFYLCFNRTAGAVGILRRHPQC